MAQETCGVVMCALKLAMNAHDGQLDLAGAPYLLHPLAVAREMQTEDGFAAALLHDVMEDSDYTPDDLRAAGIPRHVIEALCLLTRSKEEPYLTYVRRLGSNPLARAVKLADLRHNMDLSRLPHVTEKDLARLEKYRAAQKILMENCEKGEL